MRISYLALAAAAAFSLTACESPADNAAEQQADVSDHQLSIQSVPLPSSHASRVVGAELLVMGANGQQVAEVRSDAQGRAELRLAIGSYTVRPQPVEGLMGTAPEVTLTVTESPEPLVIAYDTGIR